MSDDILQLITEFFIGFFIAGALVCAALWLMRELIGWLA